jgi:hypothetical protein
MEFSHSKYNPKIKLSSKEMLEISQEINQEFAPNLLVKTTTPTYQYNLSPQEMLEISEGISLDFAPKASNNKQELVLLPIDPDHVHAYWNLSDGKTSDTQNNAFKDQLTLRVYSKPETTINITETKSWFDVAINSIQSQQNISLPSHSQQSAYSASIGKRDQDNTLTPFASSNTTQIPLGKVLQDPIKEIQIIFKPLPKIIKGNQESSLFWKTYTSGQRVN